jgi:hypothetical protein
VIDDGGNAIVGADLQELGRELISLADVHGKNGVGKLHLLEHDVDLVPVGRGPGVNVDHSSLLWAQVIR